jgi:hypothetical protein
MGGLAVAYFFYGAVQLLPHWLGNLSHLGNLLLTFTLSCTVAVFWEFGEFAADQFFGSHIQQTLSETMVDLLLGVVGAALFLFVLAVAKWAIPKN